MAAAMTVGYLSIEPFNPEKPVVGEDPQQASSGQLTVNQRLGYATLLGGHASSVSHQAYLRRGAEMHSASAR